MGGTDASPRIGVGEEPDAAIGRMLHDHLRAGLGGHELERIDRRPMTAGTAVDEAHALRPREPLLAPHAHEPAARKSGDGPRAAVTVAEGGRRRQRGLSRQR